MNHKLALLIALCYSFSACAYAEQKMAKKSRGHLVEKCLNVGKQYKPIYYIATIGSEGTTLTTHDGTLWQVSEKTSHRAAQWNEGESLIISPNRDAFYRLSNKQRGEFVNALISHGPSAEETVRIEFIDYRHPYIRLTDGSRWGTKRSAEFSTWEEEDIVLQGINRSLFGKPNVLINLTKSSNLLVGRYVDE